MNKETISEVMKELGRRSRSKRHKGKTKKEISEMYKKIRSGREKKRAVDNSIDKRFVR